MFDTLFTTCQKINNPVNNTFRNVVRLQFLYKYVVVNEVDCFLKVNQNCPDHCTTTICRFIPRMQHAD